MTQHSKEESKSMIHILSSLRLSLWSRRKTEFSSGSHFIESKHEIQSTYFERWKTFDWEKNWKIDEETCSIRDSILANSSTEGTQSEKNESFTEKVSENEMIFVEK